MNDTPAFSLDFRAPCEALKDFVSSYYLFRAPALDGPQIERADRAQLRFLVSGEGGYEFCDGKYFSAPPVSLIGPTTGPTTGRVEGPIEIFGAGLQPAAWGTLMSANAAKYTNRLADAAEILGDTVTRAWHEIAAAADIDGKVQVVEHMLEQALGTADRAAIWLTRIVDDWLTSNISPQVADLAEASGLSSRQLERLMNRYYGGPPKFIARKYRALRASSDVIRKTPNELVVQAFYDQSHLARELKQFTGATPGAMRDAPSEIMRTILDRRKELTGRVARLISDT